jgi:hypothetical protein
MWKWLAGAAVGTITLIALVALGSHLIHAVRRHSELSAQRFLQSCGTAGFTADQCGFLAEINRRANDANDDSGVALGLAATATGMAAASRR